MVKKEIKKETKDFLELNENEGTTYPNWIHNEDPAFYFSWVYLLHFGLELLRVLSSY